jgi:hypothetical protein
MGGFRGRISVRDDFCNEIFMNCIYNWIMSLLYYQLLDGACIILYTHKQ